MRLFIFISEALYPDFRFLSFTSTASMALHIFVYIASRVGRLALVNTWADPIQNDTVHEVHINLRLTVEVSPRAEF